jgi:hypothetical protein
LARRGCLRGRPANLPLPVRSGARMGRVSRTFGQHSTRRHDLTPFVSRTRRSPRGSSG